MLLCMPRVKSMLRVKKVRDRRKPLHFLAAWRRKKNYAQAALAERMGVTHGTISRAETGTTALSHDNMVKLLGVLQISAYELYCDPADTQGVWALASKIAALPDTQRATVETMVDALAAQAAGGGKTETTPTPSRKQRVPRPRA